MSLGDYLINFALRFREFIGGFLEPALPWLHTASIFVSILLLWGIIYCVIRGGWATFKYDQWTDLLGVGDVGRRRQLRGWKQILKRIKTNDSSNWKVAILEADRILDDILKMSGYLGATVHDRFQQVTPEVLSNIEKINQAHQIRDRIAREPDFSITREEAIEILKLYQQAFKELGLLD